MQNGQIMLLVIVLLIIVTNLLVLLSLWGQGRRLRRVNLYIANLCVADLLVAAVAVWPMHLKNSVTGPSLPLCAFMEYLQYCSLLLSIYSALAMGVDRYLALCHPLMYYAHSKRNVALLIFSAWAIAGIFAIPITYPVLNSSEQLDMLVSQNLLSANESFSGCLKVFDNATFPYWVAYSVSAVLGIPLVIHLIIYSAMVRAVHRSARQCEVFATGYRRPRSANSVNELMSPLWERARQNAQVADLQAHRCGSVPAISQGRNGADEAVRRLAIYRARIKTAMLALTVTGTFVACFLPFAYSKIHMAVFNETDDPLLPVEGLLDSIHSVLNPIIYFCFNHQFLVSLFCHKRRRQRRERQAMMMKTRRRERSCVEVGAPTRAAKALTTKAERPSVPMIFVEMPTADGNAVEALSRIGSLSNGHRECCVPHNQYYLIRPIQLLQNSNEAVFV